MTSQPSIEHKSRAANWFRKPSFSQFKLKSGFFSSPRSSPYSDLPLSVQSSSTTVQSIPSRATSTYSNSRRVRSSPVIVPIMPAVRFTELVLECWSIFSSFSFGSSSSINLRSLDQVLLPLSIYMPIISNSFSLHYCTHYNNRRICLSSIYSLFYYSSLKYVSHILVTRRGQQKKKSSLQKLP